ncbi:hypothetical protein ABT369_38955 [Dactylosporangium sp. NPDC000244]
MTRTAVACPEPPPRRNEPVTWTSTTTGNTHFDWVRIDTKR